MMRFHLCLLILLLHGCSTQVQPEVRQVVDDMIATRQSTDLHCKALTDPSCAIRSPLLRLGSMSSSAELNHVAIVNIGENALKVRLHLIRAAREKIEFQNFLFRKDDTGGLIIDELLKAAKRGVRVRILFDQMFTVTEQEYLAGLALEHSNFEVRLYNPLFNMSRTNRYTMFGGVACCFTRTNQRMHNKLLVVDDLVGMTGGRNIADRYFDFDTDYNFKDREVLVYGHIAAEMSGSFEQFWESDITTEIGHLRDVAPLIINGDFPEVSGRPVSDRLIQVLEDAGNEHLMRELFVDSAHEVDAIEYFFDPPHDGAEHQQPEKDITEGLHAALAAAERSVIIQSPYLVLSNRSRKLFRDLRKNHPDVDLLFSTNSLAATDAFSAYAYTHKHKKHYIKSLGFDVYEFRPYPQDSAEFFPRLPKLIAEKKNGVNSGKIPAVGPNPALEMPAPRSGLHAKSFVIDGFVSMVGSHNLDPRGEGFNTENGVIIYDEGFAQELENSIRRDMLPGNSWVVAMKPRKVPVLGGINSVIESISRSLPIFDIWPYRSTSLYALKPDATPVLPGAEGFYENYSPIGSFPDVISQKRRWQVIMVSSFLGFITPVL